MKKVFAISLALAASLAFIACDDDEDKPIYGCDDSDDGGCHCNRSGSVCFEGSYIICEGDRVKDIDFSSDKCK